MSREESAQIEIPARGVGRVVGISSLLDGETTGQVRSGRWGPVVSGTTAAPGIFNEAVGNLGGGGEPTTEVCPPRVE